VSADRKRVEILFEAITSRSLEMKSFAQMPEDILKKTHYSWLAEIIKGMPEELRPLFLSVLAEKQAMGICKILKQEPKRVALTSLARPFFLASFYKKLAPSQILPASLLPKSDFSELAEWGKAEILELIDLLGLHDLSTELRKIVDNRIIKEIYNVLSLKKQNYLKKCLMNKEKLLAPKLDLNLYRGDPKKLMMTLHRRGLIRLGKALSKESPYLLWHLSRALDTGRGAFFLRCTVSNKTPIEAIRYLQRQVREGMEFLEKESK
jgi:hypothetical protein